MALFGRFGKRGSSADKADHIAKQEDPAPAPAADVFDGETVIEGGLYPADDVMNEYIDDPQKLGFIITKEIISKQSEGV